jgi:hypothetical protein
MDRGWEAIPAVAKLAACRAWPGSCVLAVDGRIFPIAPDKEETIMGIFSDILNKLRGKAKPAQTGAAGGAAAAGTTTGAAAGTPAAGPAGAAPQGAAPAQAQAPGAQTTLADVDVEKIMDQLVSESGQKLNWRTSIVDTLKALGIDSSLEHRKSLAQELKYDGDMNDSAAMNIWLQKRVMKELASHGGKLPPELMD